MSDVDKIIVTAWREAGEMKGCIPHEYYRGTASIITDEMSNDTRWACKETRRENNNEGCIDHPTIATLLVWVSDPGYVSDPAWWVSDPA